MFIDPVHKPHPVSLLAGAVCFLASLLFAHGPASIIYLFLIWLIVALVLRLNFRRILADVMRLWLFLLLTFLLHLLLSGHESVSFAHFARMSLGTLGWSAAILFTGRLMLIMSVATALFQIHPPHRYGRAVAVGLGKLGRRQSTLAQSELIVTLALRLVPFLSQESRQLRMALAARGVDAGRSWIARLNVERKLLLPLVLNAFRRADQVSSALEARGWDPRVRRSSISHTAVPAAQVLYSTIFVAACLVAVVL